MSHLSHDKAFYLKETLKQWFMHKNFQEVTMNENDNITHEQYEDYYVSYEILFKPHSLDRMQIEIWITDQGEISIGIERWDRILKKFNKKTNCFRFIAGHEPCEIDMPILLHLIEIITQGKLMIKKRRFALYNLLQTLISEEDFHMLKTQGYPMLQDFLTPYKKIPQGKNIIQFKPWH